MIPAKILRFLEQHANMAFAGIRDRNLVPCGTRVSAWTVHPDGRTMTVCLPPPLVDRVVAALEENGQVALTLEEHPTHETYQLKGRYLRRRPVGAEDLALVARLRERLARTYQRHIPDGIDMSWAMAIVVPDPDVAVDVEIHEVYLQTPGPGAGARLYPPVEPEAVGEGATVRAR
jgi:hypothetical protein